MCCVVPVFTLYRILNRTSQSAALPHPCGALVYYNNSYGDNPLNLWGLRLHTNSYMVSPYDNAGVDEYECALGGARTSEIDLNPFTALQPFSVLFPIKFVQKTGFQLYRR